MTIFLLVSKKAIIIDKLMSQPIPLQPDANQSELKSTSKNSQKNSNQPQDLSKPIENQMPSTSNHEQKSNHKLETALETKAEDQGVEAKVDQGPLKSVDKPSKRQSLKSKQSAKISQKKKQMEQDQINSAAMKAIGASGKTLKEGHNQIQSNVREYSAGEETSDIPNIEPKKMNTESKRSKPVLSVNKPKTQGKQLKEQKTALVNSGKSSKTKGRHDISIPENNNEEKEEVEQVMKTRSKSKNEGKKLENEQVFNSKKRSRKQQHLDHEQVQQKEEVHANMQKQNVKSSKKARHSPAKGLSNAKPKHSKSALKSAARSGVKKVKIDHSAGQKK